MKKIALLMTLVLVFSLSCVFATDAEILSAEDSTVVSGETLSGEDITTPVEVSGETDDSSKVVENVSGESEGTVSGELENVENNENVEEDEESANSSSNSAMIGAIIAIVIVIAVVAIAAILRKD